MTDRETIARVVPPKDTFEQLREFTAACKRLHVAVEEMKRKLDCCPTCGTPGYAQPKPACALTAQPEEPQP